MPDGTGLPLLTAGASARPLVKGTLSTASAFHCRAHDLDLEAPSDATHNPKYSQDKYYLLLPTASDKKDLS
jgi:hypothetical protein